MTSTHPYSTTSARSSVADAAPGPPIVDEFLAAVASGTGIPSTLFTPDARLDATVPNWRLTRTGAAQVAAEYSSWFAHAGTFEELHRFPTGDGEVVVYLLTWSESGVPHAAHHCHVLTVGADGRIASDTVFCGGRWPASLLADIAAADIAAADGERST